MKTVMTDFTARLKELFGDNLVAVVLYGSAVRGVYRKGVSDINVLVLLEKSTPRKIFEMGRVIKSFLRKHRVNPRVMTREEFVSSADVFPLEYGDIKDAHEILYGDAEILNIDLRRAHLRYELEEKLRGAVGDIRYLLLASGGSEKILAKLLNLWAGLCGTIFRGLLRLKGINEIPAETDALLTRISSEYEVPMDGFSALERFRQGEKTQVVELAESLLEALKALARAVYQMPVQSGERE
jgi:predicted nucleotidyltransferase